MNEEKPHDRTVQQVVIPQREIRPQQFIIGNDETESELSVESRSFLSRVNDQVPKRQKRSSMNVTEHEEKTFYDVRMGRWWLVGWVGPPPHFIAHTICHM